MADEMNIGNIAPRTKDGIGEELVTFDQTNLPEENSGIFDDYFAVFRLPTCRPRPRNPIPATDLGIGPI